jgi:hypothetical protein
MKKHDMDISDCSSLEAPESDIKLKNQRKKIETIENKPKPEEEEKPSAIGTWFKEIFLFCGTGNKTCLGKEKGPPLDSATQNYGGMEQRTKQTKLQSFNNSQKKARRRRSSSDSSSSSSNSSDSSVQLKQKKRKSIKEKKIKKNPSPASSVSSNLDTKKYGDCEKQFLADSEQREKERLLLKKKLKEERRKVAEERKKIQKDRKFF